MFYLLCSHSFDPLTDTLTVLHSLFVSVCVSVYSVTYSLEYFREAEVAHTAEAAGIGLMFSVSGRMR